MREVREAFRAITAEEEAATALIFALQRRRYPRANELDSYKHAHKAGLTPFLRAIESMIAESPLPRPKIVLKHTEDRRGSTSSLTPQRLASLAT